MLIHSSKIITAQLKVRRETPAEILRDWDLNSVLDFSIRDLFLKIWMFPRWIPIKFWRVDTCIFYISLYAIFLAFEVIVSSEMRFTYCIETLFVKKFGHGCMYVFVSLQWMYSCQSVSKCIYVCMHEYTYVCIYLCMFVSVSKYACLYV